MKRHPSRALIVALGGNLGGLETMAARISAAATSLSELWGEVQISSMYRTAPVGPVANQPEFLNAVLAMWPKPLPRPEDVLKELMRLEEVHGRTRAVAGGARTLDLDLIRCGEAVRASAELTLPHPRAMERAFVLAPLCELFGEECALGVGDAALGEYLANPLVASQACSRWRGPE